MTQNYKFLKKKLTHLDEHDKPHMVDITQKAHTKREAVAQSTIVLPSEIIEYVQNEDIITKKGSVFQAAVVAGIMAVKKTFELIPMCHPIPIGNCAIDIQFEKNNELRVRCTVSAEYKTGVEMEALAGVTVASLTIYDMCKSVSNQIVINDIHLVKKSGGKSDFIKK